MNLYFYIKIIIPHKIVISKMYQKSINLSIVHYKFRYKKLLMNTIYIIILSNKILILLKKINIIEYYVYLK